MRKEGSALGYSQGESEKRDGGWRLRGQRSFSGCSAPLQAPRRPWRSLHPAPGVCPAGRWQATGSRARRGRVLAPRGRGRRLQRSLGRLDSAHPGALPGPRPWLSLAGAGSSCGAPWDAALRRMRTQPVAPPLHRSDGGRGRRLGIVSGRVYIDRRKKRVIIRRICPVDIVLIRDLQAGLIVGNYPNNCFSLDFPLWRRVFLKDL